MVEQHLSVFGKTIQKTHGWLNDLLNELPWQDEHQAFRGLKAVLHVLRDELQISEVAQLAAQMPMLVRGLFYEGWVPERVYYKPRTVEAFLDCVEEKMQLGDDLEALVVVKAVFEVLNRHISFGEIFDIVENLPKDLQALWPEPAVYESKAKAK